MSRPGALRVGPPRPVDSPPRTFAVLDQIERHVPEDERLAAFVREAQAGDPLAFAELYIALFDRVHRWLQVALKDREEAKDAAQQVFLRAFEALPRYQEVSGFRTWVFSIARNLAYDRLHAASRSTDATDPAALDEWRDRLPEWSREEGEQDDIHDLIAGLPRAQQRVLNLRFVSDMTTADIAETLEISPDAVRHLQHRALRALAQSLGPRVQG
jgi:RNA polymerase sigma-70 factor (ECF subfamily)